jgi:serine/threonine protein kinase
MAPEVLSNKASEASPNMDIWAIGCMMYAMVFGKLPFDGKFDLMKKGNT